MERTPVSSSNIASIGHEGTTLEVEFRGGSVYQYDDVPRYIFDDMLITESVGRYFHQYVKAEFTYRKVE